MNDLLYVLFKSSYDYSIKHTFILALVILIEYYPIFNEHLVILNGLICNTGNLNLALGDNMISLFSYLSAYTYFKSLKTCITVKVGKENIDICHFPTYLYLIAMFSGLLLLLLLIIITFNEKNNKNLLNANGNVFKSFFKKLGYNFIETVFFKLLSLFIFYAGFDILVSVVNLINYNVNLACNIFLSVFTILLGLLFSLIYYYNIKFFSLVIQYNESYHREFLFSTNYDYYLFFSKILIALHSTAAKFSQNFYLTNFFAVIIFSIDFCFILVNLYTLCIKKAVLFLNNQKLNKIRFYVLIFSFNFYIFLFVINPICKDKTVIFYILLSVTFIANIFLTLFLTNLLINLNDKNILTTDNLVYQMIYVINQYYLQNLQNSNFSIFSNNFENKIKPGYVKINSNSSFRRSVFNTFVLHKADCKVDNCNICENENYDFTEFIKSYYEELKTNKFNLSLRKFNRNLQRYIEQVALQIINKGKNLNMIYSIKFILELSETDQNLFNNIRLFYDYLHKNERELKKLYSTYICFTETNIKLENTITTVLDILQSFKGEYSLNDPINFINDNKYSINKNLNFLNRNKTAYKDDYGITLLKYIYENLFNSNIYKDYLFVNIEAMEDKLHHGFSHQSFILLQLKLDCLTIIKASSEFAQFKNKPFSFLFSDEYKGVNDRLFKDRLKQSFDNEFVIELILSHETRYIKNMKLKVKMMPSYDSKHVLIFCEYRIESNKLILLESGRLLDMINESVLGKIFKSNDLNKINGLIIGFSKDLVRSLFLEPTWLKALHFSKSRNLILFSQIFSFFNPQNFNKNQTNLFISTKTQESQKNKQKKYKNSKPVFDVQAMSASNNEDKKTADKIIFKLDFTKYIEHFYKIMSLVQQLPEFQSGEDLNQIAQYKNEVKRLAKSQTVFFFELNKKYSVSNEGRVFNLYSISKIQQLTNNLPVLNDQLEDQQQEIEILDYAANLGQTSLSSIASRTTVQEHFNQNSHKETLVQNKSLYRNTCLTIAYLLFVICYCIGYLTYAQRYNVKYDIFYDARSRFIELNTKLTHTLITVFNFVELVNERDDFKDSDIKPNADIDINLYLRDEMGIKIDDLSEVYDEFKEVLYTYDSDNLDSILEYQVDYIQVSDAGDKTILHHKNQTFYELLTIYFNNIKMLSDQTQNITDVYLNIVSIRDGEIKLLDDDMIGSITNTELILYEIIVNYFSLFKVFKDIENIFNEEHNNNLLFIFNINMYLTICLLIMHLGSVLISYKTISILQDIIKLNNLIIDNFAHSDFINSFREKLLNLKTLSGLYLENPNTLIEKIKDLRATQTKKLMENRKDLKLIKASLVDKQNKFVPERINQEKMIKPLSNIFKLLYLSYYTIIISIYIWICFDWRRLNELFNFLTNASGMIQSVYSTSLLLRFIMITNKTDIDLAYTLATAADSLEYRKYGYIQKDIIVYHIKSIKFTQGFNSIDIIKQLYQDNIQDAFQCDTFGSAFDDHIINAHNEKYGEEAVQQLLTSSCKTFGFDKYKDLDLLFNDITYLTQGSLLQYNNVYRNYDEIIALYESNNYMEKLNGLILLFLRPLHEFIDENVFNVAIEDINDGFLNYVVVYIVIVIVMDVVLFVIIYVLVVRKIAQINQNFITFINILKI
jgi:hypothetical protein